MTAPKTSSDPTSTTNPKVGLAALFFVVAFVFAVWGFRTTYTYSDEFSGATVGRIVQGDAYNYIIIATRGVAWVGVGIIWALAGIAALLVGQGRRV